MTMFLPNQQVSSFVQHSLSDCMCVSISVGVGWGGVGWGGGGVDLLV